jgi:AP-2 complex subunit sigma-1
MAIHFILLQNRHGKARITKWYVPCDDADKEIQKKEIHRLLTSRETATAAYGENRTRGNLCANFVEYRTVKLVYRRYAGLYFVMGVDLADNEMACLEIIQLLVEVLDAFFGNVNELDIVFGFHKVYMVMDEMFLAGEVQEVSQAAILQRVAALDTIKS